MPIKTFTSTTLTASDVNTYLMNQANIVVTSGTRPASPNEGMKIYETDTDVERAYTGTAWKSAPGALQFFATRATSFTISADSSPFVIPFTTEVYDDGGCYDPTTGAFLAPRTGYVQFNGNVTLDLTGTPVASDFRTSIAVLTSGGAFSSEINRGSTYRFSSTAWTSTAQFSLVMPGIIVPVTAGVRYGMAIWVNAVGVVKTLPASLDLHQFNGAYVFG